MNDIRVIDLYSNLIEPHLSTREKVREYPESAKKDIRTLAAFTLGLLVGSAITKEQIEKLTEALSEKEERE